MDHAVIEKFQEWAPYKDLSTGGAAGYEPFTGLQPWYLIRPEKMFDANEVWNSSGSKACLLAFARRQDGDDIACAEISEGVVDEIVVIEGWSSGAYSVLATFGSFDEWLATVRADVEEWAALPDEL